MVREEYCIWPEVSQTVAVRRSLEKKSTPKKYNTYLNTKISALGLNFEQVIRKDEFTGRVIYAVASC